MSYQPKSYRKFLATSVAAAMVATVAAPLAPSTVEAANDFSDVQANDWFAKNVDYLVDREVVEGFPDGTFKPQEGVTRAQASIMLVRALGLTEVANPNLSFPDTKNDAWYAGAVAALVDAGIVEGHANGTFTPNATISRAALSKMVVEAYELTADASVSVEFTDTVNGAWYENYVNTLASLGIVVGQTATTFAPNATVTRAEAAAFVHRTEVEEVRMDVTPVDPVDPVDPSIAPGTVSLATQPTGSYVAQNSPLNAVFNFNVTAGEDNITFRSIQLKQIGSASRELISNVHLEVNGEIVATGTVSGDNIVRLSRSVRVPANQTTEMKVLVDLGNATPTSTVQFAVESVDAFTTNAELKGNFPLVGKSYQVIAANIGSVTVNSLFGVDKVETYESGDVQEDLAKFSLQASSTEGIKVERLRIEVDGALDADEFSNYALYVNNGRDKINLEATVTNDAVIFDFSKSPITINRSESLTLTLKGDPFGVSASVTNFKIDNSYDILAKGINSGYNVQVYTDSATNFSSATIGRVIVDGGEPTLRVSTASPKSDDRIVASTSNWAVVREYDFISPGEDMTLKSAQLEVDWSNDGGGTFEEQVTRIQIYDAERNIVLETIDVDKETGFNTTGDTVTIDVENINWLFERGQTAKLQVRLITRTSTASLKEIDIRLGHLVYDLEETDTSSLIAYKNTFVPATAQPKRLGFQSDIVLSNPASASIRGYSLSGGLIDANVGGFRLEAKDESLEIEEVTVTVGGVAKAEDLFSNVRLVHAGEVVAVADFDGDELTFDLDDKLIVEKGLANRQVFKIYADVLEVGVLPTAKIELKIAGIDARGVTTGVSTPLAVGAGTLIRTAGNANGYHDYRDTTVAVNVDQSAEVDIEAVRDARVLYFTMENIGKRDSVATVNKFGFISNYNFASKASDGQIDFSLLDEDSESRGIDFSHKATTSDRSFTTTGDTISVGIKEGRANIEEFYLTADLFDLEGVRFRIDLDVNPNNFNIKDKNSNKVIPMFLSNEGPDFRIPRL